jgi:glc operon protein GlcG
VPLTLEEAQTLIAAAHARARELGISVTTAVVDEGGHLQALGRMDGAPPLSAQIAEAKAIGAALWHRDGGALAAVHDERPDFFNAVSSLARLPILPAEGSVPIRREDVVVGAVGVSGGPPEQDRECADRGVDAAIGSERPSRSADAPNKA